MCSFFIFPRQEFVLNPSLPEELQEIRSNSSYTFLLANLLLMFSVSVLCQELTNHSVLSFVHQVCIFSPSFEEELKTVVCISFYSVLFLRIFHCCSVSNLCQNIINSKVSQVLLLRYLFSVLHSPRKSGKLYLLLVQIYFIFIILFFANPSVFPV